MKHKFIFLLGFLALFAFSCQNKNETSSTTSTTSTTATDTSSTTSTTGTSASLSDADKTFMTKAAEGGMMEVNLGTLAAAKATTTEVKDFGNRMVADHGKANDELKQLAANKGVTLPTQPGADEKKTFDELAMKKGKDFDKAYITDMVKDHQKDIAEFEKESKDAQDPDLKAWVTKTLPTLQDHLKMANQAAAKVK
jgi:putative membrane protein